MYQAKNSVWTACSPSPNMVKFLFTLWGAIWNIGHSKLVECMKKYLYSKRKWKISSDYESKISTTLMATGTSCDAVKMWEIILRK